MLPQHQFIMTQFQTAKSATLQRAPIPYVTCNGSVLLKSPVPEYPSLSPDSQYVLYPSNDLTSLGKLSLSHFVSWMQNMSGFSEVM
jgi:hypothetical protein